LIEAAREEFPRGARMEIHVPPLMRKKATPGPSHVREETSESQDIPQENRLLRIRKEPGGEA